MRLNTGIPNSRYESQEREEYDLLSYKRVGVVDCSIICLLSDGDREYACGVCACVCVKGGGEGGGVKRVQ